MSETGRKELLQAAQLLSGLAEERKADERTRIGQTVTDFGFSEERVFLPEGEEVTTTEEVPPSPYDVPPVTGDARLADKRAKVKAANPQSKQNFDIMTDEQLNQYNAGRQYDIDNPVAEDDYEEVDI